MTGNETNPYVPPRQPLSQGFGDPDQPAADGSFGLGVFFGAVLGLWGLLGCLLLGKEETKRGARWGFVGRLGVAFLVVLVAVALD